MYGEGYARDLNGEEIPMQDIRALKAGMQQPITDARELRHVMGNRSRYDGELSSGTPVYTIINESADTMPHLDDGFWPGTAKVPKMASGGVNSSASSRGSRPGYQPVRSTQYVYDIYGHPVWTKDFRDEFDPHTLPVNQALARTGKVLGNTPDPIIKRLEQQVMPEGKPLPPGVQVKPFVMPDIHGEPLDEYEDFSPELYDALQELELMKR